MLAACIYIIISIILSITGVKIKIKKKILFSYISYKYSSSLIKEHDFEENLMTNMSKIYPICYTIITVIILTIVLVVLMVACFLLNGADRVAFSAILLVLAMVYYIGIFLGIGGIGIYGAFKKKLGMTKLVLYFGLVSSFYFIILMIVYKVFEFGILEIYFFGSFIIVIITVISIIMMLIFLIFNLIISLFLIFSKKKKENEVSEEELSKSGFNDIDENKYENTIENSIEGNDKVGEVENPFEGIN
jgi:hypothetical protein